jgi:hypothetical protein
MTRGACAACGGEILQVEVVPVERLAGPEYGPVEGAAVAGSLADICSRCDRFAGQACDKCGGRVLWEWHGPGQALWACEDCGDSDLALHMPPKPHTWKCSKCDGGYYSWTLPADPAICASCGPG